jgi:hypothetical protein
MKIIVAMLGYYMREMLAALIMFSALFACISGVSLLLFLLGRADHYVWAWARPHIQSFAHPKRLHN